MPKKAKQLTPRQIACRANGKKGGLSRAKNLSKQRKQEIASSGGRTTHLRYGDDYFGFIAKKRKNVGRYSSPVAAR